MRKSNNGDSFPRELLVSLFASDEKARVLSRSRPRSIASLIVCYLVRFKRPGASLFAITHSSAEALIPRLINEGLDRRKNPFYIYHRVIAYLESREKGVLPALFGRWMRFRPVNRTLYLSSTIKLSAADASVVLPAH